MTISPSIESGVALSQELVGFPLRLRLGRLTISDTLGRLWETFLVW